MQPHQRKQLDLRSSAASSRALSPHAPMPGLMKVQLSKFTAPWLDGEGAPVASQSNQLQQQLLLLYLPCSRALSPYAPIPGPIKVQLSMFTGPWKVKVEEYDTEGFGDAAAATGAGAGAGAASVASAVAMGTGAGAGSAAAVEVACGADGGGRGGRGVADARSVSSGRCSTSNSARYGNVDMQAPKILDNTHRLNET